MREAVFAGVLLYALWAIAGVIGSFAMLFSRHRWLTTVPIMAGFITMAIAPGTCEEALPAGITCRSDRPGGADVLEFVRGLFWGMVCAWVLHAAISIGGKFGGAQKEPRPVQISLQMLGVVAVLGLGGAILYLLPRDSMLEGARQFVAADPQVLAVVGRPHALSLAAVRRDTGGTREMPIGYREYQFVVSGERSSAQVMVRVFDANSSRYELVSVR